MIVYVYDRATHVTHELVLVNVNGGGSSGELAGLLVPRANPTLRERLHGIVCRLLDHHFTAWRVGPLGLTRRCVHCKGTEVRPLQCAR